MLYLTLSILNPFERSAESPSILSFRSFIRKITKNWALELCFYEIRGYLLDAELDIRTRGNHIGLSIHLAIMRYKISFDLYNINHAQDNI
jgi:hypothetical protein